MGTENVRYHGTSFINQLCTAEVGPASNRTTITRLPESLKTPIPAGNQNFKKIKSDLQGLGLHTVCEEARCPNISECWGGSNKNAATTTIMLMGDICTRGCRFWGVKTNRRPPPLDPHEPEHTAEALARWGLGYVVLTDVDRDNLADGGARHWAETIRKIKAKKPSLLVEALTGNFSGDLDMEEKVMDALQKLKKVGVNVVTFGSYIRPTKRHPQVENYVMPEEFEIWRRRALNMGFLYVESGPLVRSSYKAGKAFIENMLRKRAGGNPLARLDGKLEDAAKVDATSGKDS
ncbi:hypothetical protein DL767_003362 [Monosporascus sp. MG133]|nr:hypothetical protein DL767_003362 [Monosporascus sp. MG133]